jgi:hypothetical protein
LTEAEISELQKYAAGLSKLNTHPKALRGVCFWTVLPDTDKTRKYAFYTLSVLPGRPYFLPYFLAPRKDEKDYI